MKDLAGDELSLRVLLHNEGEPTEWIEVKLSDLLHTIEHRQEVGEGTPRTYRRKEALVIAMRQLIDKALQAGLISVSVSLSDSKTLNTTRGKRSSGTSSTGSGS